MSNYKRQYIKENTKNKILGNPELLFGLTHKDSYDEIEENQKIRLLRNKSNSLLKNKNKIMHSNSTSHIRADNYNIININVNNFIINNNEKRMNNQINNNQINNKINNNKINNNISFNNSSHNKIFSKAGNVIIEKIRKKTNFSMNKNEKFPKNKLLNNLNINNNNIKSFNLRNLQKNQEKNKILIEKEKFGKGPTSDIKDVIKELINDNKDNENKVNQILNLDNNILSLHIKLWEELFNIENYADNKNGISNHVKKVINLMEKDFIQKERNHNIFVNAQLNRVYSKMIKIYFVLIAYIKFLLVDFNYEMTIKSNIKRLLSTVSNHLLIILISYVSKENFLISKNNKEFFEVYSKLIKVKKIKKTKELLSVFCSNTNKNLDLSIYVIKQFSNNFFKVGYFTPIHNILSEILILIDSNSISEVADIIISGVLYYQIHCKKLESKNTATFPNVISLGGAGGIISMASLGFIQMPAPFLPKLPQNLENSTYTLVLDLDETLVHFFFTPSGGTFLLRPFCFKFLEEMKKIFEIVIFTAATKDYADSILDVIDPHNKYINHRLYRSHTTICDFTFVKDLSKIGRNLNRTLIIDNLADNFKLQPNNGIQIGTWTDDMKDTQLKDLSSILGQIIVKNPEDLGVIIKKLNEEINKNLKKNMNINPFKDIDVNKLFK